MSETEELKKENERLRKKIEGLGHRCQLCGEGYVSMGEVRCGGAYSHICKRCYNIQYILRLKSTWLDCEMG